MPPFSPSAHPYLITERCGNNQTQNFKGSEPQKLFFLLVSEGSAVALIFVSRV